LIYKKENLNNNVKKIIWCNFKSKFWWIIDAYKNDFFFFFWEFYRKQIWCKLIVKLSLCLRIQKTFKSWIRIQIDKNHKGMDIRGYNWDTIRDTTGVRDIHLNIITSYYVVWNISLNEHTFGIYFLNMNLNNEIYGNCIRKLIFIKNRFFSVRTFLILNLLFWSLCHTIFWIKSNLGN
jgi:hypothetical protein